MPVKKTNIVSEKRKINPEASSKEDYSPSQKDTRKMRVESEMPKTKSSYRPLMPKNSKVANKEETGSGKDIEKTHAEKVAEEDKIVKRQRAEKKARQYLDAMGKKFPSRYKFEYMNKMPKKIEKGEKPISEEEYMKGEKYVKQMGSRKGKI